MVNEPTGDQIDEAIAATEPEPERPAQVPVADFQVMLTSSGVPNRWVLMRIPSDVTPAEVLELVGWLTAEHDGLKTALTPRSPLEVVRGMPAGLTRPS